MNNRYQFSRTKIQGISFPLNERLNVEDYPTIGWAKTVMLVAGKLALNFRFPHNLRETSMVRNAPMPSAALGVNDSGIGQEQAFEELLTLQHQIYEKIASIENPNKRKTELFTAEDSGNAARIPSGASAFSIRNASEELGKMVLKYLQNTCNMILQYLENMNRGTNMEQFKKQFPIIGVPDVAQFFVEDDFFAHMQVGGPNPMLLTKLTMDALSSKLGPLTDRAKALVISDKTLEQYCLEENAYFADYEILGRIVHGVDKQVNAPLAIFVAFQKQPGNPKKYLQPALIKLQRTQGDEDFFTPDQSTWKMAKTIVLSAYGNHHELVSHLGNTHLFVERIAVAMFRSLPEDHYVANLLKPHFEGTLFINDAATKALINPGGAVDRLLAGQLDSELKLLEAGFNFRKLMLPNSISSRDVGDQNLYYPYRDYATKIWNAISEWVTEYLGPVTDRDVAEDEDLKLWYRELTEETLADLKGFEPFSTKKDLCEKLTMIIFTASAQHAAVNYPQGDLMDFMPAFPLHTKTPAPQPTDVVDDKNWFALLPDLTTSLLQLNVGYLLGSVRYTTLGGYDTSVGAFQKDHVLSGLNKFIANLKAIQKEITDINTVQKAIRPYYAYEYLLPVNIPQSINI